ncbi:hypothetical protein GCM10022631_16890 [Deinococcus rubellus]|uniref:Uncharacterized protein n=1 Tax=Deinococcus rubellus TaxID=1889240 RepID=A0ABY5YHI6_9DEIO|nr:hypothetical protein [Deinococcus rubellus]UWX64574.1 hypothetical protein N0D28_02600 [Deinococcus rubellus]
MTSWAWTEAYLSVSSAGSTQLYSLNLTSGAAILKTSLSNLTLRGIALELPTQ